jgi:prolyl-tRNA synthetase
MAEEKGFNIDKEKNFSDWLIEVIKQAELADQRYNVKGFIVHRPNAAITEKLMYQIYESELERRGHRPTKFPSVVPKENFEIEAEHVEGFAPEVFWITRGGSTDFPAEEHLALVPTSETAMFRMYAMWIRSWRDLPLKLYQSRNVFRYETKATHPFLRDREFYWIETHDAFASKEGAEAQVLEDMEMSEAVLHQKFGIPFLFFKRPEWDKFAGAVYTFAADAPMPDGKMIQLPSTHLLGQNFAKPFGVKFIDKDEKEKFVWQTCYGPAISRIYVALISIHGDNRGLILPFDLAPTQVVMVPVLGKGNDEKILKKCEAVADTLIGSGVRVAIDNSDKQPGAKFYFWELRGVPLRIEIGAKELDEGSLTMARRDTGKREKIKENELAGYLQKAAADILKNLTAKADAKFKTCIHDAKSLDEVKKALDKGGFARAMFCSREMEGVVCADKVKEQTRGEVRGTLHGKAEKASGKCVVCGKPAKEVMYVARAY